MKILLFGATGCFGTAFDHICDQANYRLIPVSHQDLDIVDYDRVADLIRSEAPEVVVNAVAIVGINPCEADPDRAFAVHASAALNMMRATEETRGIFVQTSTHAVFDGAKRAPYVEDDEVKPLNVYAASKFAAERFAENICSRHIVVRFPTMFGPRRNNSPGFADKMLKLMGDGKDVRVAEDKIDSPTYSFDAAQIVLNLIETNQPNGVYHVANDGELSLFEFVLHLRDRRGFQSKVLPAKDDDFPSPAPKAAYTALASDKLGPHRPWHEALDDYLGTL